ncbi:unnamed protein product, partial [Ostreobium quekettii]
RPPDHAHTSPHGRAHLRGRAHTFLQRPAGPVEAPPDGHRRALAPRARPACRTTAATGPGQREPRSGGRGAALGLAMEDSTQMAMWLQRTWASFVILGLCCQIAQGADIRIKTLDGECNCWTRRDSGIVTLEKCGTGPESIFNETDSNGLQSSNGECLTQGSGSNRNRIGGAPCPAGGTTWTIVNDNQYFMELPGSARGFCPQNNAQQSRVTLIGCFQPGSGNLNRWEILDASEDPCPTGTSPPSRPPNPPPSPSPNPSPPNPSPSPSSPTPSPPSPPRSPSPPLPSPSPGVTPLVSPPSTSPSSSSDGSTASATAGVSTGGSSGTDDDDTIAAIAAGSVAGALVLAGVSVLAVYVFLRKMGKADRSYKKAVDSDSHLNAIVMDKGSAPQPLGDSPAATAASPAAHGVSVQPLTDSSVQRYKHAEAAAPLLSSSIASSADSFQSAAAGGGGGPIAGLTKDMLDNFAQSKDRAGADPHKLMESTSEEEGARLVAVLNKKLAKLHEGSEFAGRYVIEEERFSGSSAVVFLAKGKFNKQQVAIKFFADPDGYEKEIEVRKRMSSQYIARLEDAIPSKASGGLPDALVFQRGDYTLGDWLKKSRPKPLLVKLALSQILEGLQEMHKHYIIHRDLKPSNIMFFSEDYSWKLTDLDNWARAGEPANVAYTLMYAPPESVTADIQGKNDVVLETSADMFSFGIIGYEVSTGMRFFGPTASPAEVRQKLLGFSQMPDLNAVKERQLRRLIANTLQRDPQARWSASTALGNAYFRSADDTLQQAEKFDKVAQQLARIEQMVAIAADEIRSANLMVNIVLEALSPAEQAGLGARTHFEFHPGNECPLMTDEGLPDHPIFMMALEQSYKMNISVTHEKSLPLRIQSVDCVHVTPVDGPPLQLQPYVTNSAVDEVCAVALWNPAQHGAPSLLNITPSGGPLDRRLVPVDVGLVFTLQGQGSQSVLRGKLFIKMHRAGEKFLSRKMFRRAGKMWDEAPQWVKDGAKGAMFCYNVATTVLGA